MNAEKEQLSVAHAVLRKKKIRGRACMHATVLLSLAMVLLNCRSGENETQNLTLMPQMGQVSAITQKNSSPWVWKSLISVFLIPLVSCLMFMAAE